jgi:arylformamidase
VLIGPAWVVHLPGREPITAEKLAEAVPAGTTRLLIRTGTPAPAPAAFDPAYVALAPAAAAWLLEHGIRLVGIDAPSVDPFAATDFPVHRALLAEGVVIVENLALAGVPAGACELICLPLLLAGCDGAPARVIVMRDA